MPDSAVRFPQICHHSIHTQSQVPHGRLQRCSHAKLCSLLASPASSDSSALTACSQRGRLHTQWTHPDAICGTSLVDTHTLSNMTPPALRGGPLRITTRFSIMYRYFEQRVASWTGFRRKWWRLTMHVESVKWTSRLESAAPVAALSVPSRAETVEALADDARGYLFISISAMAMWLQAEDPTDVQDWRPRRSWERRA